MITIYFQRAQQFILVELPVDAFLNFWKIIISHTAGKPKLLLNLCMKTFFQFVICFFYFALRSVQKKKFSISELAGNKEFYDKNQI